MTEKLLNQGDKKQFDHLLRKLIESKLMPLKDVSKLKPSLPQRQETPPKEEARG